MRSSHFLRMLWNVGIRGYNLPQRESNYFLFLWWYFETALIDRNYFYGFGKWWGTFLFNSFHRLKISNTKVTK